MPRPTSRPEPAGRRRSSVLAGRRRDDAGSELSTAAGAGRRVALVLYGLKGGGIERSMLRLADGLTARGLAVDIVVGRAEGELLAAVPPGARVVELRDARLGWLRLLALAANP